MDKKEEELINKLEKHRSSTEGTFNWNLRLNFPLLKECIDYSDETYISACLHFFIVTEKNLLRIGNQHHLGSDELEDFLQEAFIVICEKLKFWDPEKASPITYLDSFLNRGAKELFFNQNEKESKTHHEHFKDNKIKYAIDALKAEGKINPSAAQIHSYLKMNGTEISEKIIEQNLRERKEYCSLDECKDYVGDDFKDPAKLFLKKEMEDFIKTCIEDFDNPVKIIGEIYLQYLENEEDLPNHITLVRLYQERVPYVSSDYVRIMKQRFENEFKLKLEEYGYNFRTRNEMKMNGYGAKVDENIYELEIDDISETPEEELFSMYN